MQPGRLYLIPVALGDGDLAAVIPEQVRHIAASLKTFIAENPKTARHHLKFFGIAAPIQEIRIFTLDKHTPEEELENLLAPVLAGEDVGLMSETGCPAVADPGARLVRLAHRRHVRVVPLVGPSSILLALMASGMNGQRFVFHGYLPTGKTERIKRIEELETESRFKDQTQIFIETPYRNRQLLADLVATCHPSTELCIASNLTLKDEQIATRTIGEWRENLPEVDRKPTVFLLYRKERPRGPGRPRQGRKSG
jgi:16S rRNA (cytidine1402-2'-O)-methyltransferase